MAEVTGMRNNALPYPVYGLPFAVVFPILDVNGDYVAGAAGLDSEVSLNGDTFADCTNEATQIATSSGVYYLLLTAAEMTADVVTIKVKTSTSNAKYPLITLYPRKLVRIASGTCAGGASGYMTLASGSPAIDDYFNGCLVHGVLDTLDEVRIISDYTGSSKQAAVTPDWNTAPDSDDTYEIFVLEGMQILQSNLVLINHLSGGVDRFERATRAITKGTVGGGSTVTSVVTSSLDPAASVVDQFKGLILAFDKDTATAGLRGQKTDITGSSSGGVLTVTSLTSTPASGDTFTIE